MPPSPLPVPNATASFWRSVPHPTLDDHRSTPELPSEVDIAVIGAGYAGVSTVYHILDVCRSRGIPTPRILILEARQACSGATGRNGGHLKPDPYNRPSTLAATHGVDVAAECASFEAANLAAVKRVVEDEGIDCDFVLTRAVDALMTDDVCAKMGARFELLRKHRLPTMDDVYFAKGAEAEQLSGVKGAKGCVTYSAGHLFPYKLILGLLSKVLAAGSVNLQTHTPVTSVPGPGVRPDADGYLTLTTPRGPVRARNIVHATNAYASAVLPEFAEKIVPVRGICSHIQPAKTTADTTMVDEKKPEGETQTRPQTQKLCAPLLPNLYIVRWSEAEYEYLIPRLDGSVVVGGARSEYYHDLGSWYGNVDDGRLIEAARGYFDGYMQRVFHGWEDSGAHTAKVWTGIMGYSTDNTPHVGLVPERENQFILAGFTGHGMPQVFLAAKGVASMVVERAAFQSTGIPRIYETTKARLERPGNSVLEGWKAVQKKNGSRL